MELTEKWQRGYLISKYYLDDCKYYLPRLYQKRCSFTFVIG